MSTKRYGIFELTLNGPAEGNPFTEQTVTAVFISAHETKTAAGFYDGNGIYKVRFMPSYEEEYSYTVRTSFGAEEKGTFTAEAPEAGNHGPVRVSGKYHFRYEDGTPYFSVGTTCYVWELQTDALQEETLRTLEKAPFNKIRFCIFPKHYDYNLNEPWSYPYVGTPCDSSVITPENFSEFNGTAPGNDWDFTRFNPVHFRHIEECIEKLGRLGIEADLILFHPYDRWGFSRMSHEEDLLYLRYVIARFAAYRNVWWALANEYDILTWKTQEDWEDFGKTVCENDPYGHLRSIHNCIGYYDHSRPWITHCSIQRVDVYRTAEETDRIRETYGKPVVQDEICYEGNIQHGWGNIGPQEMVRRFWETAIRGGYPGHGETYLSDDRILWWSHGGILKGESPERIRFLRDIFEEGPAEGVKLKKMYWDCPVAVPDTEEERDDYYLIYFGINRPSFRDFVLPKGRYRAEVIDTWNMTVEDAGIFDEKFRVSLPGHEYMAVRIRRVNE